MNKTNYILISITLVISSCFYKFKDVSIPADIKTVKLNFLENKARYINPQLSPRLTEKLQQKIVSQTKLSRTTSDDADWVISGYVSEYRVSTSGLSNQQVSSNSLAVSVHIVLKDNKKPEVREYDVSKTFEFPGSQSLQQAESSLTDKIITGISEEIFNSLFSQW